MPAPFKATRRVEFADTDAAGIMHFSAFFKFMEEAEHELLRHCGLSVVAKDESGVISWPRVNASCEFSSAARFEDELEVLVVVLRRGAKSVTYGFTFQRQGETIARGKMTSVCCRITPGEAPRSIAIPAWIVEKLPEAAT